MTNDKLAATGYTGPTRAQRDRAADAIIPIITREPQ